MHSVSDNMCKFAYFLVVTAIVILFLPLCLYFVSYRLINNVDSSIYVRYATNQKFEENIFFSEEIEKNTGIVKQLESEIKDFEGVSQIQEFAYVIAEHKNEVENIVSNNEKYQKYLISVGSSVEDMFVWSEKTAALDEKILMGCIYLTFLFVSVIMVILFGFRKIFYLCAGVTYIFAMLSMFTDGVSDYLVVNVLSILEKLSLDVFTYRDIEQLNLIFHQAFKESTLTFIIFDTVIQIYQNSKKERLEKSCRYIYFSVGIQYSYIEPFQGISDTYVARMKIPVEPVIKYCTKKIRNYKKKMKNKTLSDISKNNLCIQCDYYEQLRERLIILRYNDEKHTTKEYLWYFQQIQWLMYKCALAQK